MAAEVPAPAYSFSSVEEIVEFLKVQGEQHRLTADDSQIGVGELDDQGAASSTPTGATSHIPPTPSGPESEPRASNQVHDPRGQKPAEEDDEYTEILRDLVGDDDGTDGDGEDEDDGLIQMYKMSIEEKGFDLRSRIGSQWSTEKKHNKKMADDYAKLKSQGRTAQA
eukprot:9492033-Pyramimonas_sp.AAC.2